MADISLTPGHTIENLRNTISDYPKLWEWEGRFDLLPQEVKDILGSDKLVLLLDSAELPGFTIGDTTMVYKGARTHYGTRMKLNGEITLNFKEIQGSTPGTSWLVSKSMQKWKDLVDNFFADAESEKKTVQGYKTSFRIDMQDEYGNPFYKVRYFGMKPTKINPIELNYTPPADGAAAGVYPIIQVTFTYDFWRDFDDEDFGPQ